MNAMKRHKLAKHSEHKVSYSCVMCNAVFKTKWSLSTHKSKYHRDKVMVIPMAKADPECDSTPSTPTAIMSTTAGSGGGSTTQTITVRKLGQATVTPTSVARKAIQIATPGDGSGTP